MSSISTEKDNISINFENTWAIFHLVEETLKFTRLSLDEKYALRKLYNQLDVHQRSRMSYTFAKTYEELLG